MEKLIELKNLRHKLTTAQNPTTAGLIDFDLAKVKAKREKQIAQNRERLTEKYGTLADYQIVDIVKAEKELAECEKCSGLPCHKSSNQTWQPHIMTDEKYGVYISNAHCRHYESYLQQRRLEKTLASSRIPPRYLGKTFADYEVDADNESAVKYAKKKCLQLHKGTFFYGERGTGKTFLASIIAQEFIKAGLTVIFIKVPQLLDEFYSVYRKESDTNEKELLQTLYSADLLILDDFGMEKATKFAGTTLCKIIDARYDNNAMTIITSNYPLDRIQNELDNATDGKSYNGSRIADRCSEICKPILFKGNSRRK